MTLGHHHQSSPQHYNQSFHPPHCHCICMHVRRFAGAKEGYLPLESQCRSLVNCIYFFIAEQSGLAEGGGRELVESVVCAWGWN